MQIVDTIQSFKNDFKVFFFYLINPFSKLFYNFITSVCSVSIGVIFTVISCQ